MRFMNQDSKKLVDTNILVYAEDNNGDLSKHQIALNLIRTQMEDGSLAISVQNLVEFSNVLSNKYSIKGSEINSRILDYKISFSVLFYSMPTIIRANAIVDECGIDFFDALITATMEENQISIIITENESDFKKVPWLTVINPFKGKK